MPHIFTPTPHLDALLDLALAEDIGCGDATGAALIPADATATFEIQARQDLVFCGAPVADRLLWRFGPGAPTAKWHAQDGDAVSKGTVLGTLTGDVQTLLIIERPLLNLLQRMSGVATLSRRYVDAIEGTGAKVIDTRKTLRHPRRRRGQPPRGARRRDPHQRQPLASGGRHHRGRHEGPGLRAA